MLQTDIKSEFSLKNYIKYCLSYIKIAKQRSFSLQQKKHVNLPTGIFSLIGLLNGEYDGSLGELVNLETFYSFDPKKVPEEKKEEYESQRLLANQIEDLHNRHRNDQFTKQINLNFGYFEVELPVIEEVSEDVEVEEKKEEEEPKYKKVKYPLFAIPVRIQKDNEKYTLYTVDTEVLVNLSTLEPILEENLYYQLVEKISSFELDGKLTLPIITDSIFVEIWHRIKEHLKLKEAIFDEESFDLNQCELSLLPRANYFLAEDLRKLADIEEEELKGSSLLSWIENEELSLVDSVPNEHELYFPFPYDQFQLQSLSIINNKASIIEGPPGTGKSETIANLLCHLAATGKKVLFVSQKAQALKVVKDKLKRLNIKYLFGYIPNPASAQLDDDDEVDAIAPQLTALKSHVDDINSRMISNSSKHLELTNLSLNEIVDRKNKLKNIFSNTVEVERKVWKLNQELKKLKEFDIGQINADSFARNLTFTDFTNIKKLTDEINNLKQNISFYDSQKSHEKQDFEAHFSYIDFSLAKYSTSLQVIKDDISKTAFDGHSKFLRKLNNWGRGLKHFKSFNKLPREIKDYITQKLCEDISRNQATKFFESLANYTIYKENLIDLEDCTQKLQYKLNACGISGNQFHEMYSYVLNLTKDTFDEVKSSILRISAIRYELNSLDNDEDHNLTNSQLLGNDLKKKDWISLYIQNIINKNVSQKWQQGVTVKQIINKLAQAFGKSKKAYKTFDNLRKNPDNFSAILEIIPVWIMELDDASRIVPFKSKVFDYVILDEASQCNIAYTLPVMYRAKKAIFVGDSEQMKDNTIMFKSNKKFDELARVYRIPEELQIKATGAAVQSVLDISNLRGFHSIALRNHYRSPKELIGFSNEYFYKPRGKSLTALNSNYLTFQDTNKIMLIHEVFPDLSMEISNETNHTEAMAILKLFKELRSDVRYKDKSIGILSFFNAQANYMRKLFEDEGFVEEKNNYKVSIVEGIQGDEKDIIIYSFVIKSPEHKNKYTPLTGEGGDIRGAINKGRVNVAFSRARLQVHCFISLPVNNFPDNIWIKKYLKYIQENGEIHASCKELNPFDSYFEEEFFHTAKNGLSSDYLIFNQVKSCGFKIDFVINNTKTGKRLAVECDGPTHFKDEYDEELGIYIENDEQRQRILEAAKWDFYRIKYSNWINDDFDRKSVLSEIKEFLDD